MSAHGAAGRLAAVLLAAAAVACGGGGGGGPTAPPAGIVFTASGGSATNGLSLGSAAGSTSTILRLDLSARSVTDLYGVAFDLVYPNQILAFDAATQGTFLGGVATSLQVDEPSPGRLVVGLSRLGAVSGVSGSGVVLTLEFASRATAGSGSFAFQNNAAFDSAGDAIAGVGWGGGSVSVTP
jgi:hypothetical protein